MRRGHPSSLVALLALAIVPAGCNWRSPPLPAPPPPPAAKAPTPPPPVTKASAESPPSTPQKETPEASPPPDEPAESTATSSDPSPNDQAADVAANSAASTERILLFAPQGPLIVELQLSIDGQPHTAALARLVEEVLALVDADGDGRPRWKELCASKRLKYGQYGNLPIEGDNGEKQIVERYDIDRDGEVDRTELPRFLTRNAGSSRPFSIRGTADYRDLNRRGAPTWQLIDASDDGALSPDEWQQAASRLASRDLNDDEMLVAADLNPRLAIMDPAMQNESRRRGPDAARMLGEHADWGGVRLALENQYGGSRSLNADRFPLTPDLFGQLDANGDGRLARDEFPNLNKAAPHVVIAVEFGKPATPPVQDAAEPSSVEGKANTTDAVATAAASAPRLKLVHLHESLAADEGSVVEQPGRLTLRLAGMNLTLYTNDTVQGGDFAARAEQALAMYDGNKDGYLVADEVPEAVQMQLARFEALDADGDGKVYAGEIMAFQAQQQAGLRAQIHAKASDQADALFAVLDADHDERIDSRELESVAERLASLDRDGDNLVTPEELPEAMLLGFARGSLENMEGLFAPPPVAARGPDASAPRWFTSMDANADGAISYREFLGTAEAFQQLDRDGNGLVEAGEIAAESEPAASAP